MGEITQAIKIAERDFSKKLYFKEDIEKLIFDLENCIKDKKTDTEQTVRMKILRMFASYGIEFEKTLTPEQYREQLELHSIQSIKDFPEMCWNEIMKFNLAYKTPKEYMERLVNELVSPEYDLLDSPIRVKILKQILGKLDCLRGTSFQSKKLISIIENDYDGLIGNIGDEIFENNLATKHYILPHKYLRALLDVYKEVLYMDDDRDDYLTDLVAQFDNSVKGKTAKELLKIIRDNNPEEKKIVKGQKEEIKKVYNILSYSESLLNDIKEYLDIVLEQYKKNFDVEVKKIEAEKSRGKQFDLITAFIARRNLHQYAYTEEFLTLVEQQIKIGSYDNSTYEELCKELSKRAKENPRSFTKINQYLIRQIKEFKKEKNAEFKEAKSRNKDKDESVPEILYICDDLAEGRYKTNSKMKEVLYLFAFAFDMSISFDNDKERTLRDVRKSLFEDFYCDNIIRYVNEYKKNGVYEEPTGITIQFKNFVEIVYLYWLNKDSKTYSSAEKYLAANVMIKQIVSRIKSAERYIEKSTSQTGKKYFEAKKLAEKKVLGTYAYRNFVRTDSEYGNETLKIDNFLDLPEDDFLNIILDKFDVDTAIKYTTAAAFDNENYQTTAEEKIKELIAGLTAKVTHSDGLVSNYYPIEFYKSIFDESVLGQEYDENSHAKLLALVEKINEQMLSTILSHLTITKKGNDGKLQKTTCRITGKDYDETFKTNPDTKKIVIEHFPAGDYTISEITDEAKTDLSKSINIKCLANQNIKINIFDEQIECNCEDQITRTRYMLLYYYDFVQSRMGTSYAETFDDFYDEYCESLNIDLEDCSYQLFSEKNLIDMMLLYSAFITLRTDDN